LRLSQLPRRLLAATCAAAVLLLGVARAQLPTLGDGSEMTSGAERKLGERIARELYRDPDYIDDPVLVEYVQGIWQRLLAAARSRGELTNELDERFAWTVLLGKDRTVNAFALPGGWMGLNLGLVSVTANDDELASVLAHELSHVTQRHISRLMAQEKQQTPLMIAAMVLGAVVASRNPQAGGALMTGGQALAMQNQLNFSRDMEREADRVGWQVMTGAGFAPGGMAAMFEKLEQSSRLNDFGGYPYLRSHPLTSERIGEARGRLGTVPPAPPVSVLEHSLAQARSRVLMDSRFDALRRWQALDGDRVTSALPDKLANAYESAFASTLLRDFQRSDGAIAAAYALVREAPGKKDVRAERSVALLQAQSLIARGESARAVGVLQPYVGEGARPGPVVPVLGVDEDTVVVEQDVRLHPRDPSASVLV